MKIGISLTHAMTHNHNHGGLRMGFTNIPQLACHALPQPQIAGDTDTSPVTSATLANPQKADPEHTKTRLTQKIPRTLLLFLALAAAALMATLANPATTLAAPPETSPIWRAQFRLVVADVSDAGTDDDIKVQLNAQNITWLDYARNDYERNSTFTYDLRLNSLRRLSDITMLKIAKEKTNALCIRSMSLIINGRTIYTKEFGNTTSTCKWIDNGDGHVPSYTVSSGSLRAHASWKSYIQPAVPTSIKRAELESRIEGTIGSRIKSNKLSWGDSSWNLYGRGVEATRKTSKTVHVDLDLAYDVPGPNPEVDVDFDMTFSCSNGKLTVVASNYDANVKSPGYDYLNDLLEAFGIDSVNNAVKDHLASLVSAISLSSQFDGECPNINVEDDADVVFTAP